VRVYLALGLDELTALADGEAVTAEAYVAASTDEEDELAALEEAAENGQVAAAAEVDYPDGPVTLADIASFHLDTDGTGHLAWYAPQEVDAVIRELRTTAPE
jgi:hypothetical protein